MRSTPLKGVLVFLITLSMAGYLFHAQIPTVYGEWINYNITGTPLSVSTIQEALSLLAFRFMELRILMS